MLGGLRSTISFHSRPATWIAKARELMTRRTDHAILTLILAILATGLLASQVHAQTLRLRQAGSTSNQVNVQVGQVINIEVIADLQGVAAAGVAFFITVPSGAVVVNDLGLPGQVGKQPFRVPDGSLFAGAATTSNLLLPETDAVASSIPGQQIDYSAVIGLGSDRNRTGSGVVAVFQLVAVRPLENGKILIDDNPIRETKLVLSDGVSDRRFVTTQGLELTITGLQVFDIPDVILQPGESDSIQIGSLDQYLFNTLSPADSIRWTFEPAEPDSVTVTVDPQTRVVKIVPFEGWRGSVRLVWTATDPQRASPGQPLLSTSDASTIVVNNRPTFDIVPDADGVKRIFVRLVEDRNTFVPGVITLDERRAFRGLDLDDVVLDLDDPEPDLEFNYAVTPLPPGKSLSDVNVRGDDSATHDLLIWSRPDFGGTDSIGVRVDGTDTVTVFGGRDSLRVIVQDRLLGRDTLRVIVEVEEMPDAPRIIEEETDPRIARGGTKTYVLTAFAEDPDTPLEDVIISWVDDPDGRFTVDTTRTAEGNENFFITVTGAPDFVGTGRVVIRVADPLAPSVLFEEQTFFFTSAEALPPSVFPDNIKVPTEPGGVWTNLLDDFVSDPDNSDSDLFWSIPSGTTTTLGIDAERLLSVMSPDDFHGYEEVQLTVSDPGGQSDELTLRIYSSDGRPVTGGIPDLILDRGAQHREFDLDDYYHDSNNSDEQMVWRAQPTFDENNLSIFIDPLTHIVTFSASPNANFGTETVVLRVTDTDGESSQDTVLVTIQAGGGDSGGAFQIIPDLPSLQAQVGQATQVIDNLNDFIVTTPDLPRSSITWELADDGNNGIAGVSRRTDTSHPDGVRWVLTVFGEASGIDTLVLVAADSLGRSETALTTVRYIGESEFLKLRAIPDIVFIAGQFFEGLVLNDFILDREAHPDSSMSWTFLDIGTTDSGIIIDVNDDSSVRVLSFDIAETEVVFIARDDSLGVTGRDTVRVIAQDPALAERDLQDLPPLVIQTGGVDSSVVLNDFLPPDIIQTQTYWSVSGASITNPVIDPLEPHRLRVGSIGTAVGTDTLEFRVNLGGGITASGQMLVTIIEPVDELTLTLQIVPNPVSVNFVDFFVIARKELSSSPTVVVTFEGDTTVAVRQIEDALNARGALIWAGSFHVRAGGMGTLLFRAQAVTALGTLVSTQALIVLGTASSGKPLALSHGAVEVLIPADAVPDGQLVLLQSSTETTAAKSAAADELVLQRELRLWPAGLRLGGAAHIVMPELDIVGAGLYRPVDAGWEWVSTIDRLGRYGVLVDRVAPYLDVQVDTAANLRLLAVDGGSGIDPESVFAMVDGERFDLTSADDGWSARITVDDPNRAGRQPVLFVARDRAGNETRKTVVLAVAAVPREMVLGANFPNPFNPETTIPLQVPSGSGTGMRLRVYNATGQVVRELLGHSGENMEPGWHEVRWDGRDHDGRQVSSGVYFYRLDGAGQLVTRSMTMLK